MVCFLWSCVYILLSVADRNQAVGSLLCRQTLLEVAAAGPAAGAAASLACLLLGLGLSAGGLGGVTVEPSAFEDSLLVGVLGTRSLTLASRTTRLCICSASLAQSGQGEQVSGLAEADNSRCVVLDVLPTLFCAWMSDMSWNGTGHPLDLSLINQSGDTSGLVLNSLNLMEQGKLLYS